MYSTKVLSPTHLCKHFVYSHQFGFEPYTKDTELRTNGITKFVKESKCSHVLASGAVW